MLLPHVRLMSSLIAISSASARLEADAHVRPVRGRAGDCRSQSRIVAAQAVVVGRAPGGRLRHPPAARRATSRCSASRRPAGRADERAPGPATPRPERARRRRPSTAASGQPGGGGPGGGRRSGGSRRGARRAPRRRRPAGARRSRRAAPGSGGGERHAQRRPVRGHAERTDRTPALAAARLDGLGTCTRRRCTPNAHDGRADPGYSFRVLIDPGPAPRRARPPSADARDRSCRASAPGCWSRSSRCWCSPPPPRCSSCARCCSRGSATRSRRELVRDVDSLQDVSERGPPRTAARSPASQQLFDTYLGQTAAPADGALVTFINGEPYRAEVADPSQRSSAALVRLARRPASAPTSGDARHRRSASRATSPSGPIGKPQRRRSSPPR